ncbi:hypothetical protein F3J23_20700 [Chryseobacterium sp. Tr-659]|uniref:hypothetical protein n=1 Tax=Chryseobacterium sp. Tr-659 TaxID=2608340 RepID=UPI001421CC12|nr:hypothetical protein [Chryseobacterium sp. Tr-659]NIF07852.1 hypothetical protein [Chryseobacterium sp. Tr-659]
MAKIILEGWNEGLQKVSLTKLQIDLLGKSLKESKLNVDYLLDDKEVIIEIENLDLANEFIKEAEKIGVSCKLNLN